MGKTLVLLVIFCIGISRWILVKGVGRNASFMLISLFVQTLPFAFGKGIYSFLQGKMTEDYKTVRLGEFGNIIKIEMPTFFIILLLLLGYHRINSNAFYYKNNKWFYILLLICFISFVNPYNQFPAAFLTLLFPILQFLLLFKFFESNFTKKEILKGIYDGLMMTTILQFALAMCYPVLGMQSVTTLFRETGLEWSQRRGMSSAIGTFGHPSHLAFYCLVFCFFFIACYYNSYFKTKSRYLIILNCITLVLTFSRTTIICAAIIIPILVLIQKKGTAAFSAKNIFLFSVLSLILLLFIYISPIGYLFFESDSTVQLSNRFIHWSLGYQMWESSKLIGIGLNSHVYYMLNKLSISINADISMADTLFFLRSPIHNIHMIVFAETGLIGLSLWWYYFSSKIRTFYAQCRSYQPTNNIFNLTFVGVLLAIFLYGFFGWTPFTLEVYSLCILLGYFARTVRQTPSVNRVSRK